MSTSLAELIRAESSVLAAELVARETLLLQSLDRPWRVPEGNSWVHTLFNEFQADFHLRQAIHQDALSALAGVLENDSSRLGQISDWLRCHCYLYAHLSPPHLQSVSDLAIGYLSEWRTRREALPDRGAGTIEAAGDDFVTVLIELYGQLERAIACFTILVQLEGMAPADHRSPSVIESYWNAAASVSAMFTIDWASFGREDLFNYNGFRAASWLREEGFATPSSHILQIGCGMGRIERHLAPLVKCAYGIDISQQMIRLASKWLSGIDNVRLFKTDGRRIPLPDSSLETVFSFLVFIHIHDPQIWHGLFNEVARVLKQSGHFLFTLESNTSQSLFVKIKLLGKSLGLEVVNHSRVNSRQINSFRYAWDWLLVFQKKW